MADLSLTNSPLLRDLFDTPDEALLASQRLGITGYRVYTINGVVQYVPGATYLDYEKALRLNKVQGAVVARGSQVFGDKLVGYQFANSKTEIKGDPFFTFGNFSITTSAQQAQGADVVNNDPTKAYSAQTITDQINESAPSNATILLEDVVNRVDENMRVQVVFDKRKLENYVLYSSLKERIKQSVQEIVLTYPGALHWIPVSIFYPTITKVEQFVTDNHTVLTLNTSNVLNPFGLDYNKTSVVKEDADGVSPLRNFSKTYDQYVVYYNGLEYQIMGATLPKLNTDAFKVVVQGLPFSDIAVDGNSLNVEFYIKPNAKLYAQFYDNLGDMAAFLLNKGDFSANIFVPYQDDNGNVVNQLQTVVFPTYDQFNIDLLTDGFDSYLTQLNGLADEMDQYKTNLIARFLTTESLQEFDTEDRRFNAVQQIYGRTFDEVKRYIDGLTYMRTASYDKVESIPDALVKNFARMLGFETFEIQDEDTLIQSLFDFGSQGVTTDITPAELDIEIWRRILVNAFYLFKAKGTRKSIQFLLELIGVPESIIEINEYVYLAENKVDTVNINNALFGPNTFIDGTLLYPFDADGYPTTPKDTYFQSNGGYLRLDDINIGPYDFGKNYINKYKKFEDGVFGFEMERTIDNQKSWVNIPNVTRENYTSLRHTFYEEKDNRLVVNSKELDVYIALNRIFDVYPYRQFTRNGVIIGQNDPSYPTTLNPNGLTFDQYLAQVVSSFINVRNRKVISTYPTLSKIYYDYVVSLGSSESYIDFRKSMEFINKFDTYWIKFIEQFIPATTIVNAGKKIDNSVLLSNKFRYRHGRNDSLDWRGTDGSEFQNKALRPVYGGAVQAASTTGYKHESYRSVQEPFDITGIANRKYTGVDSTFNNYLGIQYSISDYCEMSPYVHVWQPNTNYTTYQDGLKGVFVIYKNKLYRLPSDVTESTSNVLPNDPNGTPFEVISDDADPMTVTFTDNPNPSVADRDYYVAEMGFAFAYKQLDADFDCPPPKPHVCYYDFDGNDMVFQTSQTLTTLQTQAATPPTSSGGTPGTVGAAPGNQLYGYMGGYIMQPGYGIDGNGSVLMQLTTAHVWVNGNFVGDQSGYTTTDGRLNRAGIWVAGNVNGSPESEWIGFSRKITLTQAKTMYVGLAADNEYRLHVNGVTILDNVVTISSPNLGTTQENFRGWMIYPVALNAGDNYIEMLAQNLPLANGQTGTNPASFAAEIYDATAAELQACTTVSQIETGLNGGGTPILIFSTKNMVGQPFNLGTTVGYSCPAGWSLDTSGATPVCVRQVTTTTNQTHNLLNYYEDDFGTLRQIRQPKYYGFSSNTGTTKPFDAEFGVTGKWTHNYYPQKTWTAGVNYFPGEIVTDSNGVNYVVNQVVLGTAGPVTGATVTSVVPGLYEKIEDRKKTDPFMHIQPAYLDVFVNDPTADKLSINLTKNLSLYHIFSGTTQDTTYKVVDNIIEDQVYISDAITLEFDGLYPTKGDLVGPNYIVNKEESFVNTTTDSLILKPGVWNYVDMRSFGTGFTNSSVNFVLTEELPGYYLVKKTSFLTFKFDLYFESDFRGDQDVLVSLVNQNGNIYNQERFTFSGNDIVENRIMSFTAQSVFTANQRLYLAIQPVSQECSLVKFEKISFDFDEKAYNETNYFDLYDTRFRVNFNGGRSINDGYYYDPVISISPVANVFSVASSFYETKDDSTYANNNPYSANNYRPRRRTYNEIEFTADISEQYPVNYFYDQYFKKYQTSVKQAMQFDYKGRHALDKQIGYNKIDFTFSFQTRSIPSNADYNAKVINGETSQQSVTVTNKFLGNTVVDHENAEPSKNIIIGGSPELRGLQYDSDLSLDGTISNTIHLWNYSSGLADYANLNYKNKSNYYDLNYVQNPVSSLFSASGTTTRDIDHPVPPPVVRNSDIYQTVLAQAERFDARIINYKMNDVVKYLDPVLNVDVLYVCVRDLDTYHSDINGMKPQFQIGGDWSVFVEMSKYNPRNYELDGYKDSSVEFAAKGNIKEFRDDAYVNSAVLSEITGSTTSTYNVPSDIQVGQIIRWMSADKSVVRDFKLTYTKDMSYNVANGYLIGDYILYNNKFWICKAAKAPGAGTSDPSAYFAQIDPFDTIAWYNPITAVVEPNGISLFSSAVKLPMTTTAANWSTGKLFYWRSKRFNGQPFTAYGYMSTFGSTYPNVNLYTVPVANDITSVVKGAYPKVVSNWVEFHNYETANSYMPLFEVTEGTPDIPVQYSSQLIFNQAVPASNNPTARKMGDNKTIFTNKIYSYIGTGTWQGDDVQSVPAIQESVWEPKDFMLAESLTYYRERTKIKVYDGQVISLTTAMRDGFTMFNPDTSLAAGFTSASFSPYYVDGFGIVDYASLNQSLENGLITFKDATDTDRKLVVKYGAWNVRQDQNDVYLDYFFQRDATGNLPVTGEFVGKLRVTNPCGHSATVIMGVIMANQDNSLDLIKPTDLNIIQMTVPQETTPYTLRLIFNQTGRATGTITWSGAVSGSAVISENNNYDNVLTVQPDQEITFVATYTIVNSQTKFDYAYLDDANLYPFAGANRLNGVNNETVVSAASYDDNLRTETRTVTIKTTKENHILRIGLQGVETTTFNKEIGFTNIVKFE